MSAQTVMLVVLAAVVLAAFAFYPALMLRLVKSLVVGIFNVVVDAFAVLLTWI